ncbi:MAG: S-methyl-5-thioribose-1-phosphate isomerase [Duodenibacillus sp.]|nr:S-methyl-5-thioribose-1-phosphate isomerase [Duodenibacillus sp.]
MLVNGRHYRTIWTEGERLFIIDQTRLPHAFEVVELASLDDVCRAVKDMLVRGAGLIGAAAGYGVWMAAREAPAGGFEAFMRQAMARLKATRPTASNLAWAVDRQARRIAGLGRLDAVAALRDEAERIADEDAACCKAIGEHGAALLEAACEKKGGAPVNMLTHCNAGWLAFVDYGSALSPVYEAVARGVPVHVWVDETRPRNQGASLTAFELAGHGVPHDLIADNAGGHLMQHGMVDIVITGADRVTRTGDAANKIGTYLKALAARDNGVPFHIALPSSTFDFSLRDGVAGIPIEERGADEVRVMSGMAEDGLVRSVRICPQATPARNWGFDVTPARLITSLITERGVCPASEEGILGLYPEAA